MPLRIRATGRPSAVPSTTTAEPNRSVSGSLTNGSRPAISRRTAPMKTSIGYRPPSCAASFSAALRLTQASQLFPAAVSLPVNLMVRMSA